MNSPDGCSPPRPPSRRAFLGVATALLGARRHGWVGASTPPERQAAPLLKVALNGQRPAGSHPALPTSPQACAGSAAAAVRAGAGAVHVHVRGREGAQSIDPSDIAATVEALRAAVPDTPIGVSTTFSIVNDVRRRHEIVSRWSVLPDFASVNFSEEGAVPLANMLLDMGVQIEAGLFHTEATRVCVASGLAGRCLRLMLEPRGADVATSLRNADEMEAILDAAAIDRPRLLHGSRDRAWPLIAEAARRGYQTRAGLEDTFEMPDGRRARDNAEIVAEAARRIAAVRAGA